MKPQPELCRFFWELANQFGTGFLGGPRKYEYIPWYERW